MKKINYLKALSLLALTVTGCGPKTIQKEEFVNKFNEIKTYLADVNNCPENIHINDKLSVNRYDYKEGEFYSYHMFAMILIVPVLEGHYTWKEDGKYYHAEEHTDSKKNKYFEITEEQFNTYMFSHKQTIMDRLNESVLTVEELLKEESQVYSSIDNKYYEPKDGLRIKSSVVYTTDSKKGTITVDFKNKLPVKKSAKTDSESYMKYTLNEASFFRPGFIDEDQNSNSNN